MNEEGTSDTEAQPVLEGLGVALGSVARGLRDAAASKPSGEESTALELPSLQEPLSPVRERVARGLRDVQVAYRSRAASLLEYFEAARNRKAVSLQGEEFQVFAAEGQFVVAGRVTDRFSCLPVPALRVRVVATSGQQERVLTTTRTDERGAFRAHYGGAAFSDGEPPSEIRIEVLSGEGEEESAIRSVTRSVKGEPKEPVYEEIAIDGSAVPERLELARKIHEMDKKLEEAGTRRARRVRPRRISRLTGGLPGLEELPNVSLPLEQVNGIGAVFAERLRSQGIRDPAVVAEMSADELATKVECSPGRAERIAEAARTLLEK